MGSCGWKNAKPVLGEDALRVGDFKVKSKQRSPGLLWLHVQLPDGSWAYHVIDGDDGSHVCQALARTKKEAFAAATVALRDRGIN
jgi:hypothetical protein